MKIFSIYFKLRSVVGWLVVIQLLGTILIASGIKSQNYFTYQHEDYIFIANLMTYFIIIAIEEAANTIKATISQNR